jgi:D-2-hydroxyacid dehydrogenase (NADP+)
MTGMLLSKEFVANFGQQLNEVARGAGLVPDIVHLPDDPQARLAQPDCDRIEIALQIRDIRFSKHYRSFVDALIAARNLKWVHFHSTAIGAHANVPLLLARGVRLTTSAGGNSEPMTQTAITTLLMLGRGFPRWLDAQHRRRWEPVRGAAQPRDLRGQTIVIVGMGNVGKRVARFAQALGMHVIGIRRTLRAREDPMAHEMRAMSELPRMLPRCDWLVLACPLTRETRHIINSQTLALMRKGAGLINVARGGVADETAVIAALRSGQLGCAHLDVFDTEPLPAESPLWTLPNVILTPHITSASSGNVRRGAAIFLSNLERWARGEPLKNELRG